MFNALFTTMGGIVHIVMKGDLLCMGMTASPANAETKPFQTVARFSILKDLVQKIVVKFAQVEKIGGPDADVDLYHSYPLGASSVAAANVIFVNGLDFETLLNTSISGSGT